MSDKAHTCVDKFSGTIELMDQLLALDSLFFGLEDENVQANIGGVSILEGPAPKMSELTTHAEAMLGQLPRYRQRVLEMPPGLGRPLWIDDEDFELSEHLFEVNLGRNVSLEKVQDHFADTMATHLDRSRPLWKIQVVRGLPGDQWAILWTVHHAMVDGIAASELMALLLSPARDSVDPSPTDWQPHAAPSGAQAAAAAFVGPAGPLKPLRDLARGVRDPRRALGLATHTARNVLPIGRALLTANDSPLNGEIGPGRIWRTTELDLAKVKLAGTLHGGTVNDIVLTAVTAGLRSFMRAADVDLTSVSTRTMVPVSVRREDQKGDTSNRVSAVFVDLPVGLDNPRERLAAIRRQMDAIKDGNGEQTGEVLGELANYVPHALFQNAERALLKAVDIPRFINTVTTNVPGPQFPLYCKGREMKSLHPYIMLLQEQRICTAVFSYNGKVYFGVTGDREHVPCVAAVCEGIESTLDELIELPKTRRRHLRVAA